MSRKKCAFHQKTAFCQEKERIVAWVLYFPPKHDMIGANTAIFGRPEDPARRKESSVITIHLFQGGYYDSGSCF